jgi:hypothetical protein
MCYSHISAIAAWSLLVSFVSHGILLSAILGVFAGQPWSCDASSMVCRCASKACLRVSSARCVS